MIQAKRIAVLMAVLCLSACTSTHPESKFVGKWQTEETQAKSRNARQFEFFADGTVTENERILGKWSQMATGTFKMIDATHLKIDLGWYFGTTVYEVSWRDKEHLTLRFGDYTLQLERTPEAR